MKVEDLLVRVALGPSDLAARECRFVMRRDERVDRRKLREKFAASFRHRGGELRLVVREIEKWRGRSELLTLKEHRRLRREEQQRRERERFQSRARRRVRNLIVILEKRDEIGRASCRE